MTAQEVTFRWETAAYSRSNSALICDVKGGRLYVRRAYPNGRLKHTKTRLSTRAVPLQAKAVEAFDHTYATFALRAGVRCSRSNASWARASR